MKEESIKKIVHWLDRFSRFSNESWGFDDKSDLHNYWKGQVMGMCKVLDELGNTGIDVESYLKELL